MKKNIKYRYDKIKMSNEMICWIKEFIENDKHVDTYKIIITGVYYYF